MRFGLIMLAALTLCVTVPGQQRKILYKAAKVHVGDGTVHAPGYILVENGKIAAVGSSVKGAGALAVDLGKAEVTPGLIDAAVQGLSVGGAEEQISESVPGYRVLDGIDMGARRFKALAKELNVGTKKMK